RACKRCEPDKSIDSTTEIIERACRLIEESDGAATLKQLSQTLGLSMFHLQRQFKKHTGVTPKQYASSKRLELWGGKGVLIHYGVEKCSLGLILLATTKKGICCIELGDSKKSLKEALHKRFPSAEICEGDKELRKQFADVLNQIESPHKNHKLLPLDIQ